MPKTVSKVDAKPGASAPAVTSPDPESHKLWIHCNRCCEQYVQKKSKFFLLACHHVTCEKCVSVCAGRTPSDAPVYECPVCHNKVRGRQVNNTMPNSFKLFFHPEPFNLNNEFIATFQMANHRHFDRFKEKKGAKLHKLTKDIDLAKSICQKRYFNLEIMRVERKKLTQRIRQIKIQVAKQREEKERERRIATDRHHRTAQTQPKTGLGLGQQRHRAKTVSPIHNNYRDTSITSSSSSQKHKQVTSFRHQPNYSFNL
ncbi:RING finger protein vilya [Drosophila serrata]|uniref:RING finger protein vilya n=1 Tax=Drosophila serrata TaxID=7274 RepID=UPI000A1D2E5C|nr:RING finger protein vilya [Drosophila serrata]